MKSPQFAPGSIGMTRSNSGYIENKPDQARKSSKDSQRNFDEKLSNLKNALTSIKSNLNNFKA
jgi:hypothetical protein